MDKLAEIFDEQFADDKMNQTRKNQIKNKKSSAASGRFTSLFCRLISDQIMDSLLVKTLSFLPPARGGIIIPEGIEGFTVIRQRTSVRPSICWFTGMIFLSSACVGP